MTQGLCPSLVHRDFVPTCGWPGRVTSGTDRVLDASVGVEDYGLAFVLCAGSCELLQLNH